MLELLVKNGECVNSDSSFQADVAVENGRIVQIGKNLDLKAERVIDAAGKQVLPGIVDSHVHLPWPSASFDSVDDFNSGTTAAVFGGVTTIIEYIVPDESGRIIPSLEDEISRAEKTARCDYSFHLILRKVTDETLKDMEEAFRRGFTSFKIYTAYSGFRLQDDAVLMVLQKAHELGAIVCFHAEDGLLVNFASGQLAQAGKTQIRYYPQAHPYLADVEATFRVISYARHIGARIHIVHVNTGEGAAMIAKARHEGLPVTGETCPQYLTFTEDVYTSGKKEAAYYILSPLIRSAADREALWEAVASGDLQTIATDHCPYSKEQKLKGGDDFRSVPGGAGGIGTSLAAIYTLGVKTGRFSMNQAVAAISTNPARIFNLYPRKGVIAVGSDADLVVFDPQASLRKLDVSTLHSNADHSIFEGMEFAGEISATILRGRVVVENGVLMEKEPGGSLLTRAGYA